MDIIPTNNTYSQNREALGITHGISVHEDSFGVLNRYRLQAAARELIPTERIRICCKVPVPNKSTIEIWRKKGEGQQPSYFRGLMRCNNSWNCAVCSTAISEQRRLDLTEAIAKTNYIPVMLTYTMAHYYGESLEWLISRISAAWKTLTQQRAYKGFKHDYGYVGAIRTLEITYGKDNGWHPHFHVLMLLNDRFQDYKNEMELELYDVWKRSLNIHDRNCNFKNGIDVTFDKEDIASYVSKGGKIDNQTWTAAHELTKAQSKTKKLKDGRFTPFKLLDLYSNGQDWAGYLFQEYAYAVKGRSQLHWSRGLKQLLGIDDIAEDTISDTEIDSEIFAIAALIPIADWRILAANKKQGELLHAVSLKDYDMFLNILKSCGINHMTRSGL